VSDTGVRSRTLWQVGAEPFGWSAVFLWRAYDAATLSFWSDSGDVNHLRTDCRPLLSLL